MSLRLPDTLAPFLETAKQAEAVLAPLRAKFQQDLNALLGYRLDTFKENQLLASYIQATAYDLNVAFVCPKCGEPARLKCSTAGGNKNGVFSFMHNTGTHRGTTQLPQLILTPISAFSKIKDRDESE